MLGRFVVYASGMCIAPNFFSKPTAAGVELRVQSSFRALHVCVCGCEPDAWSAEHEKKIKIPVRA